jgi:EEF1A N-terminal glycine/lysine methyltransferase
MLFPNDTFFFQHDALLNSCENALSLPSQSEGEPEPQLLVFYTHHRPRLADRDMEFFAKARSRGWTCEKVLTERFEVCYAFQVTMKRTKYRVF